MHLMDCPSADIGCSQPPEGVQEDEQWTSLASAQIPVACTELLTEDFSKAPERLSTPVCFVNLRQLLGPCQSSDVLGKRQANKMTFQNNS